VQYTEFPPTGASIPGYDFGSPSCVQSPVSLEELHQIEASTGWTQKEADILRSHRDIFLERAEEMVDAWRSVIGSQPNLAKWFLGQMESPTRNTRPK
jgi:hypothetical protein